MKKAVQIVLVLGLVLAAGSVMAADRVLPRPSHAPDTELRAMATLQNGALGNVLSSYYSAAEISKGVYIGAEFCLACHPSYRSYKDTHHASFLRRPMTGFTTVKGKGVLGDMDGNGKDDFIDGLDFNTISSAFDAYKPYAPKLSVKNGVYTVTVNDVDYPVIATLAGTGEAQGQRFLVRMAVTDTPNHLSDSIYFGPLSWDAANKKWATNGPTAWWDATNKPRYSATTKIAELASNLSNWSSGCSGCHTTGVRNMEKSVNGEWKYSGYPASLYAQDDPTYVDTDGDGLLNLSGITCESCHGPGSAHVLNGPDPSKIVNPGKLTAAEQAELCSRCHATAKSLPNQTFGWPYKDDVMADWYPGLKEPLTSYFKDTTSYWPDGKLQKGGRPWGDYHTSLHATNSFHVVACNDCHNPHSKTTNEMQLRSTRYDQATRLTIPTTPEDTTFCLSCHATHGPFADVKKEWVADYAANEEAIGKVVAEHTHHPYAPERMMGLSNCIGCHMAPTGGGHSWRAISPELTVKYQAQGGMPNSCASACHNNRVDIFGYGVKGTATTWDGAFDKKLSTELSKYYGNGGIWWDTKGEPMQKAQPTAK